jgi:hypothetical protein
MSNEETPLSELIGSIEQKDFNPNELEESSDSPKEKKDNTFMIVVLVLLLLTMGMGGYYLYTRFFGVQEEGEMITEEIFEEEKDEVVELTEISIPDENGDVVDKTVFELTIPDDWTVVEGESSTLITKGCFSISITKNPIITGGGWGFMYEGISEFDEDVVFMVINKEPVQKITHIFPTDVVTESDLQNIFGGSVFASPDSNISTPTLELKGESYLIKYVYDCTIPISVDSEEYTETMEIMDTIVESIQ